MTNLAEAAPNVTRTINFQGRLLSSSGAVVPDGYYNMQFKIYEGGTGVQANNPDGALRWTESYVNNNQDQGVRIKNGTFSVSLGSISQFGTNVDWTSETLWLSLNVASNNAGCTTFGSAPCQADGEMLPMKRITATPYSINSGAVGGKTANDLVQLGQETQVDSSSSTSISINKTGSGNLMQLQSSSKDIFTLSNNGDLQLGTASDSVSAFSIQNAADQSVFNVSTTDGTVSTGSLSLSSGAFDGNIGLDTISSGANLSVEAEGNITVSSNSGNLELSGNSIGLNANNGGGVTIQGGNATVENSTGGSISLDAGLGNGSGSNGSISIGSVNASNVTIGNTNSTTAIGGNLQTNNLDTDSAADMNIGGSNATNINLNADTNINGKTTIKDQADSTAAFQIQDSVGLSLLNVNTLNSQVSIGSADTTATLLVLDTKTSSGDPAGTNGAMYYNSNAGKFRCYESSGWKDCVTPLPVSKVASIDTSNSTTSAIDVDDLSFELAANTKYYYKFVLIHEAANSTTGVGFGVTNPGSPVMNNWCVNTTATMASATPGHWGSYCGVGDASVTTDGTANLGTNYTSTMEGYIQTNTTAGDLQLRMISESTNQTTVKSGSFGILQIVQ